jgi:small subunit ribosomal protein S19
MKIPFVDYDLYSKIHAFDCIPSIEDTPKNVSTFIIQTTSRSSVITSNFVGKILAIHNGRVSKRILIKPEMVGFKLGCFVFTKKLGPSIHNSDRNRKKKEKMRRKITQKKARKPVQKATKTSATKKK